MPSLTLNTLRVTHYVAAALHAASFVAQLVLCIVFVDRLFGVELAVQKGGTAADWTSLGRYDVAWLILAFAPITAGFHIWEARKRVLKQVQADRFNGWRWLEYSITASIMTWAVAQTSGATDVNTLILLVFANVGMQLCGYVMERQNRNITWMLDVPSAPVDWWSFVTGSVLFVGIWYIIGYYFFASIAAAGASNVPWFVYTVFFGLLVQFAGFAVVMALHYVRPLRLWPCRQTKAETVARGDLLVPNSNDGYYRLYYKGQDRGLVLEPTDSQSSYYRIVAGAGTADGVNEEDALQASDTQNLCWVETSEHGDKPIKVRRHTTHGWIDLRDMMQYELAWIILSLVSKLWLEWFLLLGAIIR